MATSPDGGRYTDVLAAKRYTFDPATGNTVTLAFAPTQARYVRLTITANTGWPSAQIGEVSVLA